MKVEVKIHQTPEDGAVLARLTKIRERMVGSGAPIVYKKISIFLDQWVQRNFKNQGSQLSGSDTWPPFKSGGRRLKGAGLDTSAKLLQDTGALRASHLPFSSGVDAGIGSTLPYSKYHQEGIGVPMRRTLPKAIEVRATILQLFDDHIGESAK